MIFRGKYVRKLESICSKARGLEGDDLNSLDRDEIFDLSLVLLKLNRSRVDLRNYVKRVELVGETTRTIFEINYKKLNELKSDELRSNVVVLLKYITDEGCVFECANYLDHKNREETGNGKSEAA